MKYEKQEDPIISDLLGNKTREIDPTSIPLDLAVDPIDQSDLSHDQDSAEVRFLVGEESIIGDRRLIAALSKPFSTMLYGSFTESKLETIDMTKNGISAAAMRGIVRFSQVGRFNDVSPSILMEILTFANKFCCESLRDACDRNLATIVTSTRDAIDLMSCAIEENCPILAISCFQCLLEDIPSCLGDAQAVEILCHISKLPKPFSLLVERAAFSLYCFLCEVALDDNPRSDVVVRFLECLVESANSSTQRQLAHHQLGCVLLLRKEFSEAEKNFKISFQEGHVYSAAGLARIKFLAEDKSSAYETITSVISSSPYPLGWMFQERSLYLEGEGEFEDLLKATELDPTLIYPYMYRAAALMRKQDPQAALAEINRVIGFKLTVECLELRFCFFLAIEDYRSALCDIQAILTLSPKYRMFEGRVAASQLRTLVNEHVAEWTTADCWMQLYDRWSSVDDIGSLSVIYQMLEKDAPKGVLYFRQSLLLLR